MDRETCARALPYVPVLYLAAQVLGGHHLDAVRSRQDVSSQPTGDRADHTGLEPDAVDYGVRDVGCTQALDHATWRSSSARPASPETVTERADYWPAGSERTSSRQGSGVRSYATILSGVPAGVSRLRTSAAAFDMRTQPCDTA